MYDLNLGLILLSMELYPFGHSFYYFFFFLTFLVSMQDNGSHHTTHTQTYTYIYDIFASPILLPCLYLPIP